MYPVAYPSFDKYFARVLIFFFKGILFLKHPVFVAYIPDCNEALAGPQTGWHVNEL